MFGLFRKKHKCNYDDKIGVFYEFRKSEYHNQNDDVIVFELCKCRECGEEYRERLAIYDLPNTYRTYITSEHEEIFKILKDKKIQDVKDYKINKGLKCISCREVEE